MYVPTCIYEGGVYSLSLKHGHFNGRVPLRHPVTVLEVKVKCHCGLKGLIAAISCCMCMGRAEGPVLTSTIQYGTSTSVAPIGFQIRSAGGVHALQHSRHQVSASVTGLVTRCWNPPWRRLLARICHQYVACWVLQCISTNYCQRCTCSRGSLWRSLWTTS